MRGLGVAIDFRQDLILCRWEIRCKEGLCEQKTNKKHKKYRLNKRTKYNIYIYIYILPGTKIYTLTFIVWFPFKCHQCAVQIGLVDPLYDTSTTPSDIYYCIFIHERYWKVTIPHLGDYLTTQSLQMKASLLSKNSI